MKYIIDFYQDLDTLNLIIFWGIIIVIILLVIVVIILEKNKKNSKKNLIKEEIHQESIPIKEDVPNINEPPVEENKPLNQVSPEDLSESFNAEEHVIEYHDQYQEVPKTTDFPFAISSETSGNLSNSIPEDNVITTKEPLPNKPYQRNVLREMSLSQTSPIGIVKNNSHETKVNSLAQELHDSLNVEKTEDELADNQYKTDKNHTIPHINNSKIPNSQSSTLSNPEIIINKLPENNQSDSYPHHVEIVDSSIKINEPTSITNNRTNQNDYLNTTLSSTPKQVPSQDEKHFSNKENSITKPYLDDTPNDYLKTEAPSITQNASILESIPPITTNTLDENSQSQSTSNKSTYLEEVSSKLANSQNLDYVDRTEYELKQEEEAIISYEELMQKKDQIKMIDEEEAVISIEELLQKQKRDEKLYQLTDEEENDKFIRELKDFRNDL